MRFLKPILLLLVIISNILYAQPALFTTVYLLNAKAPKGIGKKIGYIKFSDTPYGLIIQPHLKHLPAGVHGFHIHVNPNCDAKVKDGKSIPGLCAGGHLDPEQTHRHSGPYQNGHLGDLPVLIVDKSGDATLPLLAPRLKIKDIENHSVMIHAAGDNYSDQPKALGGGGARLACGVIKQIK